MAARRAGAKIVSTRRDLPNRRRGYTQKARVGGHTVYLTTGEYEDGTLGEIFLTTHKNGSMVRALLDNVARTWSIALQHGVPLAKLVDANLNTRFEPCGLVEDHPRITRATSILDYVARDIGIHYLGRDDLAGGTDGGGL